MNQARLRQRIDDFRQVVFRLQEACEQPEDAFIRDSVIQRFEFSYELGWKMLKLQEQGIETHGPKSVLQQALAKKVYIFIRQEGLGLLQKLAKATQQWM